MYLLILLIIFLGLIKFLFLLIKNKNLTFVIISGVTLFFISIFRSIYFTTDVQVYVNNYVSMPYVNLSYFWSNFITNKGKDPFFYLFSKIISLTGASYRIWLAIIAGIFCYSISKFIYKYSKEPYISFIILISLGYFYFSLSGLRQTLALSIILLSYKYLRERNIYKFVVFVLLGSLFHLSAIIFLIAYPLSNIKIGWKQIIGVIGALVVAYFFSERLLTLLVYFNMNEKYNYYIEHGTTLTISGFIIQLSIYLFCLYYKKNVLESDNKDITLYNLLFLGIVFQAFSAVIAEFFRISMYFSIFSIVLIPKAINSEKDRKIKMIIYMGIFVILVIYMLKAGSFDDFKFYWQEG
ncbi:EpsG family protein [uncultured Clostridium sp.]|uniref:EpsG family protein n=1 Tax=uncultured Clostridium sp. TaxID=59620 RepID=UPI00258B1285|nr:EpsG family protein [uncultured Clostridium sp.]